jgi:hypothetical protein
MKGGCVPTVGKFDFNHIASIAIAVQDLSKNRYNPIYVEGDIIVESTDGGEMGFMQMDGAEAARCVVETVLGHPHVQEAFAEADRLWEALKWLVANVNRVPNPPDEHFEIIDAAICASGFNGNC